MDGVEIKLFGKIDFGIQTTWDMRTDIYIYMFLGNIAFSRCGSREGAQSSETLFSLRLTLQKESGVETNRYPEN